MTDRILALLALLALAAFLGVFAVFVPELDLLIVVSSGVVLAGVDIYLALFRRKRDKSRR